VGQPTRLGFDFTGRFADRDIVQKSLDVFACNGGDGTAPKERLDVPLYASAIGNKRAGLFGRSAARNEPAGLCIGKV
jgi:hypothetical protein